MWLSVVCTLEYFSIVFTDLQLYRDKVAVSNNFLINEITRYLECLFFYFQVNLLFCNKSLLDSIVEAQTTQIIRTY